MVISDLPHLHPVSGQHIYAGNSVLLALNATATAGGDTTFTNTNTNTVIKTAGHSGVARGMGTGDAYAYGEDWHHTSVDYVASGFNILRVIDHASSGENYSFIGVKIIGVRTPAVSRLNKR